MGVSNDDFNALFGSGGEAEPTDDESSAIQRDTPEPSRSREALVKVWLERVKKAKKHWQDDFKRMSDDMAFTRGQQWPNQGDNDERYVANVTLRHVSQKVAQLYAKNPTAVAEVRDKLHYQIWDENPQTLQQAQQALQIESQQPNTLPPSALQQAQALMEDVQAGNQRKQLVEKVGRTLEIVYQHQLHEQIPAFKTNMKHLVRRVVTTGVGYVELGYHREYDFRPEDKDRVTDVSETLAMMDRLNADQQDGENTADDPEAEELKQTAQGLSEKDKIVVREGLDLDYPRSTQIIPDPQTWQLKGFLGARWVAREFLMSPNTIKEVFEIDIGSSFTRYDSEGAEKGSQSPGVADGGDGNSGDDANAAVYRIYDKSTGLVYHVADGYPDFLEEPTEPSVSLERFFPIFVLTFNDVETPEGIFPPSDVSLIRDMQIEHNLARQRLREHRDHHRPRFVTSKGQFDEEDKANLAGSAAHVIVEMNALSPGDRIENLLQPAPVNPIDPNLYETSSFFEDLMRVAGTQEANLGGTSGATATESNIAESSRMTSIGSNTDDLDDFLTELASSASHVLLREMGEEKVKEIAGPGAVWPSLSAEDIAKDLWLRVKAGSSGKPNQAQEIQNFERLAPILMQVPGITPRWMAEQAIERLDDRMDLSEAFTEGLMSIAAQNRNTEPTTDSPDDQPDQQGDSGGDPGNDGGPDDSGTNQGPNNDATGAPDSEGVGAPATSNSGVRQAGGSPSA